MSGKRQTKMLILVLCLFLIAACGVGVIYLVLIRQSTELGSEIDRLNKEKNGLVREVRLRQKELQEKAQVLSAAEKEANESTAVKGLVAIDPGHQGNWVNMSALEPNAPGSSEMKAKATTGTVGKFTGIPEFQLNLDISLMLAEELENRGYAVVLTREDNDAAISNAERAVKANNAGADFAVRIHANGSEDSNVNGALAMVGGPDNPYVGNLYEESVELADDILTSYCEATGLDNGGMQLTNDMTGINWSTIPTMILEMGFMTNQSDDTSMADPEFRQKMVQGIADGIEIYYSKHPSSYVEPLSRGESGADPVELVSALEEIRINQVVEAADQGETWAVVVKDLLNGNTAGFNGDAPMRSASVIKLFIMAAVYDRVCYPSSMDRYVNFKESHDGELKELITRMITVSDNEAANEIVERLGGGDFAAGMQIVNDFCEENGYTGTHMGRRFLDDQASDDNYTTADDCINLVSSFYDGSCVNAQASAKMLEYMKNQTLKNKIPAGVGADVQTANKTGELSGAGLGFAENDVAVVWGSSGPYALCVLSGDLKLGNQAAVDRIVEISRSVYRVMGR